MNLPNYVLAHTERNACTCGKCLVSGEDKPMTGHTVDMFYFDVCAKDNPDAETFKNLIKTHQGEFTECVGDAFVGDEHSYIEIGGWLGSQDVALRFIALGKILGLWDVLQPCMVGLKRDDPLAQQMAGMGLVSLIPKKEKHD